MAESVVRLSSLSEDQRVQAQTRFTIIRPALEDGVSQAQVARTQNLPRSNVQRWVKLYREKGLAGLADAKTRSDKGKSRRLPDVAITLIEGLALQAPPRSMASIHRQVVEIAGKQGWTSPSYDQVRQIIKNIDPALKTLAHQGAAAYREEFDLLYRRESSHSNAIRRFVYG
jgi:putative transposase